MNLAGKFACFTETRKSFLDFKRLSAGMISCMHPFSCMHHGALNPICKNVLIAPILGPHTQPRNNLVPMLLF